MHPYLLNITYSLPLGTWYDLSSLILIRLTFLCLCSQKYLGGPVMEL